MNPDPYHGIFGSDACSYAKDVQDHIDFGTFGKVAGFIAETIQGVGGAVELAPGYLKMVYYNIVRKSGGVCIADEVQTGFGRTGSHFWGFETQGVIPDGLVLFYSQNHFYSQNYILKPLKYVPTSLLFTFFKTIKITFSPKISFSPKEKQGRHHGKGVGNNISKLYVNINSCFQCTLLLWRCLNDFLIDFFFQGIGNGLPLGAVVTTPEIASVMSQKIQFNTYGGNPVCSAGGLAVLKVIEKEKHA